MFREVILAFVNSKEYKSISQKIPAILEDVLPTLLTNTEIFTERDLPDLFKRMHSFEDYIELDISKFLISIKTEGDFLNIKRGINDSPYYYLINLSDGIDSTSIYEFDGKTLKKIYNQFASEDNIVGMFSVNNDLYFGFNEKLLKYNYQLNNFTTLKDFNGANIRTMSHLTGRSENDLFINMNDGIGHYNGNDVKTIFKLDNNALFNDAVLFEKDVFFVCPDPANRKFIIVHAHLK
jgi:hypothetical protein